MKNSLVIVANSTFYVVIETGTRFNAWGDKVEIETLTLTASWHEFYQKRKEIGHDVMSNIVWKEDFLFFN